MEIQNKIQPEIKEAHDELLRYSYRLDTLFDISRSLFASFDSDTIMRTCLLSTMGIFGVLKGFIVLYELPSKKVIHFVSQGFHDNERGILFHAVEEELCNISFEYSHMIRRENYDFFQPLAAIECLLPISIGENLTGFMGIGSKIVGGAYSDEEKRLFVTLNNHLIVALQNSKSFEQIKRLNTDLIDKKNQLESTVKELEAAMIQVAEYSQHLEKIIAALNVAQEVQQSLLPGQSALQKNFDLAGTSLYCDETGGDYFDYIELPCRGSDACGIVVGDVSGHGISSALLMAGVRAYLRGRATQPGSAAEIITDLNRLVSVDTEKTCQFMTLFFLMVDAAANRMTWVNAGHDPVFVYDPVSDSFKELRGRGLALGVNADWQYTETSEIIQLGQIVILTTDGAIEAHNDRKELFGKQRFKEIIQRNASLNAEGVLKAIVGSVEEFRGGALQHDDITLVVLKFRNDTLC